MEVDVDEQVPMKVPPIPFDRMPTSYYNRPNPPPVKEPPMPKSPPVKASFLSQVADRRDLDRLNHRASAQIATMGKAASTSLITGMAAKAAEQLGAN